MAFTPQHEGRQAIYRITQPAFPNFVFEWHPQTEQVYFISQGAKTAHSFAQGVGDHGAAQMAVLVFLRGYRQALVEMAPTPWEPPKQSPIPPVAPEANA